MIHLPACYFIIELYEKESYIIFMIDATSSNLGALSNKKFLMTVFQQSPNWSGLVYRFMRTKLSNSNTMSYLSETSSYNAKPMRYEFQ